MRRLKGRVEVGSFTLANRRHGASTAVSVMHLLTDRVRSGSGRPVLFLALTTRQLIPRGHNSALSGLDRDLGNRYLGHLHLVKLLSEVVILIWIVHS